MNADPLKMNGDYNRMDRIFIRIKDFVLVGGALWAFLMWTFNFASIPKTVEANSVSIKELKEEKNVINIKFVNIERDIKEIKESQNRLETNVKEAINRRPS